MAKKQIKTKKQIKKINLKRYTYYIVSKKERKEVIGYKLRLFFKSEEGERVTLDGKFIDILNIESQEIDVFHKIGFMKKSHTYHPDFVKEMLAKNKDIANLKTMEIVLKDGE